MSFCAFISASLAALSSARSGRPATISFLRLSRSAEPRTSLLRAAACRGSVASSSAYEARKAAMQPTSTWGSSRIYQIPSTEHMAYRLVQSQVYKHGVGIRETVWVGGWFGKSNYGVMTRECMRGDTG